MSINGRALHFVFKIGDRGRNAHFFRDVLGMRVLRHEEFKEGCDAQCNGPYDQRWSKTMVGYGPEADHFVIELTYNYGVKEYQRGNEFGAIRLRRDAAALLQRASQRGWPTEQLSAAAGGAVRLRSPDGYAFDVLDDGENASPGEAVDPVAQVTLRCADVGKSVAFWRDVLDMAVVQTAETGADRATLAYKDGFRLAFEQIADPIDRGTAYGRIAFAVPLAVQPLIAERVRVAGTTVLTPLITLDTPGKATVRVIILADPDGHEICFVDEEGFGELSAVEENASDMLDRYIGKDPFQAKAPEQ